MIVAPGPRDSEEVQDGARIVRFKSPAMPYDATYHAPLRLDRMRALAMRENADVLQVSSPFVPAMVAKTMKAKLKAYVYHSEPIGVYLRPVARKLFADDVTAERALAPAWALMRSVCNSCDVTVTAGHWLTSQLMQNGCHNAVTCPFGINHEDFGPDKRDEALRKTLLGPLADDPSARLFLICGRLAMDKRQRLSVQALLEVAKSRKVALVVLGDGPERDRIMQESQALPHASFVKFTRDRAEYAAILASVDALLHASLAETYGFVLAEALTSGTPVVAPSEAGAGAIVTEDCGALYGPRADASEVARTIERLLTKDGPTLSAAAQIAGRAQPSTQQHFDSLFELYASRLSSNDHRL